MTNIQQPEMRRSGESPTTKQRTEDADPTQPPGGPANQSDGSPVPKGQASPYGPGGKVADDASDPEDQPVD
jgi:hypothetical protein